MKAAKKKPFDNWVTKNRFINNTQLAKVGIQGSQKGEWQYM